MVMAAAPIVSASTPRALTGNDHAFAVFCEQGLCALMMFAAFAGAPTMQAQRVHTGYMPKAQRNAAAHGFYKLGVRTGSKRETVAQRTARESRILGLAS